MGRFPEDFIIQLSKDEYDSLRRHFGTLKREEHSKFLPYAFTEQGVAMLSSVLNSERAVKVNIEIMRAFVRLRRLLPSNTELARKLDALEKKYDAQFKVVFDAIRELMKPPEPQRRKIGFQVKEGLVRYGRGVPPRNSPLPPQGRACPEQSRRGEGDAEKPLRPFR